MRREDAVDEARDRRARDVHDADGRRARALRVGERGDGVGRLARLRDPDDERPRPDEVLPVAELGGVVDLDRDAGDLLEEELPDEPRVPARPAGDDDDPVDPGEELRGDPHRVLAEAPRLEGELVPHRLDDDRRLLGDLLRHEVGVAPLLGRDGVPRDAPRGAAPRHAVEAGHLDRRRRQPDEVAVLEEDEVARVREERRRVGGDEVLPLAEAEDDRRPALGDVEDVRLVGREDDDGVHPRHPREDRPDDLAERRARRVGARGADRLGDDLGVRLRREGDARARRSAFLSGRKFSMIPLWMTTTRPEASRCGWAFSSEGRPCVAQRVWPMPVRPGERLGLDARRQVPELPLAPRHADEAVVAEDGDAGRVVAAVLEALQAVDEDRRRLARTDVPDDAAHGLLLLRLLGRLALPVPGPAPLDRLLRDAGGREGVRRNVLRDRTSRRR